MLSVGNADAIIVWLKDHNNNHYVTLIDGGNKSDGEKVIKHLEKYILKPEASGKTAPDLIISTHHDKDHIGGLIEVVNHYKSAIGEVWVNNPADHMGNLAYRKLEESFRSKSINKQYQVILESLTNLDDFISVVDKYKIPRFNALAGRSKHDNIIQILGPSEKFYKSLLPGMDGLEKFVTQEADWAYNSIFGTATINESLENSINKNKESLLAYQKHLNQLIQFLNAKVFSSTTIIQELEKHHSFSPHSVYKEIRGFNESEFLERATK